MSFLERLFPELAGIDWYSRKTFNVAVGLVVLVVMHIVVYKWMLKHEFKDKAAERAMELGHVVTGVLINEWRSGDYSALASIHATYEYEVAGKKYQYRCIKKGGAPNTVELYYLDNPKRAFEKKDHAMLQFFISITPWAAAIAVTILLGGV